MAKIDFVPENYKPSERVTPSIKFHVDGEYRDATIYIDDIAVAFFDSSNGGLTLLPIEVGPNDWGSVDDLKYLQDRGFSLDKKKHRWQKKGYYEYYIQINKG